MVQPVANMPTIGLGLSKDAFTFISLEISFEDDKRV